MPSSRTSLRTLRAISALFLAKILKPVVFMAMILLAAAYVLMILLSLTFSSWWLLLLVLLVPLTLVVGIGGMIFKFLLQKLLPRRVSDSEKSQINAFLDKLLGVAERAKLPYPVLVFLVAKDVVRGKESKFLGKMIGDSKALMTELGDISRLFKE